MPQTHHYSFEVELRGLQRCLWSTRHRCLSNAALVQGRLFLGGMLQIPIALDAAFRQPIPNDCKYCADGRSMTSKETASNCYKQRRLRLIYDWLNPFGFEVFTRCWIFFRKAWRRMARSLSSMAAEGRPSGGGDVNCGRCLWRSAC